MLCPELQRRGDLSIPLTGVLLKLIINEDNKEALSWFSLREMRLCVEVQTMCELKVQWVEASWFLLQPVFLPGPEAESLMIGVSSE